MKKIFFSQAFVLTIALSFVACTKKSDVVTIIPPVVPPFVTNLINLPAGWKLNPSFNTSLPTGIQVYQFDTIFLGNTIKAFCVAYDSKNTNFEFKPIMAATVTTPTAFASAESGITYACINGGFFGSNQSFSLVKYNNIVSSANIKALTRVYNSVNTSYYPTRAAFGVSSTGVPSVGWIYNVGAGNDLIYSYPTVSANAINTAPQPIPTATFPANGAIWNVANAIGGSPMLIKNNTINITDAEELIVIDNATSRARSAIGYNANGIVLVLAIEGGNPPYNGINLVDLASLLKNLSCTDAINLDGGGSTSMVVGGTRTVRPSDGTERGVISAILIKKK